MDSNNRVEYHIYTKVKNEWFDKSLKAKEYHPDDNFAITKERALALAGKTGRVWKIMTIVEQIYEPSKW